ncbi:MAG: peptidoglycan editing factor PgeF [Sphingomonadaceae bacterium]
MRGFLTAPLLGDVPHGFSTRAGIDAQAVLPGAELVLLRQVHSPDVVTVTGPFADNPPPADALVTKVPGLLLGIVTADCGPVLFVDRQAGVVGAAHAGWRGALGGVVENTVVAMEELGAKRGRIRSAIGPMIAQDSYEVDAGLRARFCEQADDNDRFFAEGREGHFQFDLPGYIASRIASAGIDHCADLACDTYADPARFCSYRRATHRGESTGGRQTSVIGILPDL